MLAPCPHCGIPMSLDGHRPGQVVRCSCEAVVYITTALTLELIPEPPRPRPSLWLQTEQLRVRLTQELESQHAYQVEGLASQLRHLLELCRAELRRRGDPDTRLRRDP